MPPIDPSLDPESAFTVLRRGGAPALVFDGRGGFDGAWSCRVAIDPRVALSLRASADDPAGTLRPLDTLLARRRAAGGPGGTGVAVLSTYEAFAPRSVSRDAEWDLLALEVDGVIAFRPGRGGPSSGGRAGT